MYTLLNGVRVIELSLLAPDLLGMHLADLGADVIKIEQPPFGDHLRDIGARKLSGINLMHFRARELLFEQQHPSAGPLRLFATPVKIEGEAYSATPAPGAGEQSDEVLSSLLSLSPAQIAELRATGVVGPKESA
jgi:crotonobetainyl-CoA:carnitine CoA-transferase CaiB-like acyl-CoA transferase